MSYYTIEQTTPITVIDGHYVDDHDEILTNAYLAGVGSARDGRKVFGLIKTYAGRPDLSEMTHMCYEIERADGDPHFVPADVLSRAADREFTHFYFDVGRGLRASYDEMKGAFERLGIL